MADQLYACGRDHDGCTQAPWPGIVGDGASPSPAPRDLAALADALRPLIAVVDAWDDFTTDRIPFVSEGLGVTFTLRDARAIRAALGGADPATPMSLRDLSRTLGLPLTCANCNGPINPGETHSMQGLGSCRLIGDPQPTEGRWRVGRKLGRTLYVNDTVVGMVDTPELAEQIVAAMGQADPQPTEPDPRAFASAAMDYTAHRRRHRCHGRECAEGELLLATALALDPRPASDPDTPRRTTDHAVHACIVCAPDRSTPGPGCVNCRQTGLDQTPCVGCPGDPQPTEPETCPCCGERYTPALDELAMVCACENEDCDENCPHVGHLFPSPATDPDTQEADNG